ncbi:MAG: slipin family protein [Candidatus Sumerlaeia bacterium]
MPQGIEQGIGIIVLMVVLYLLSCIKILKEYERGVIFRLGRILPQPKGPGLIFVLAPIDRMIRVPLRTIVMDVPPQDVITRDNVSVKVNAVAYFRVVDPIRAIIEVEDFLYATSQMAQTTLRSVLGEAELDELLSHREKLSHSIQELLDKQTDPWGIKVSAVELKHIDLPQEMQRAMARQAEAERERRAKIISADGDAQASLKFAQAAQVMENHPMAMQMRFLQSLSEIASERASTIIFPLPIEILGPFFERFRTATRTGSGAPDGSAAPAPEPPGEGGAAGGTDFPPSPDIPPVSIKPTPR